MRRSATVPLQDSSCATNRLNYRSMADYEKVAKGQLQGYLDRIQGYEGYQYERDRDSKEPRENNRYYDGLNYLQLAENNANSYIKCINKDIIQRNDYTSRIYSIQQEIEVLRKQAEGKKEIVQEAKERSSDLENPYATTTWWESWFPLGRPIQKENVPVLLSISILMLVFSLGIFLRFAGMELRFESITTSTNSLLRNINTKKPSFF